MRRFNACRPPNARPRRVVMLAPAPVQLLDVVGPSEVFSMANRLSGTPLYRFELVSAEWAPLPIRASSGLALGASAGYRSVRGPVDTLMVAGGEGARQLDDPALLSWLRRKAARAERLASVCTGAFVLAAAGLLHGKRATTHWAHAEELQERYPGITVDPDPIWICDANVYTSAGVTAGMDLTLELVAADQGRELALAVARQLVLFLHRPGGQAQFSVSLNHQLAERPVLRSVVAWMLDNLSADLSLDALAARAGMSVRNFCRVFEREQGTTPGRFVHQLRLEAARRELEQGQRGLKEVAARCGFGSDEALRLAFQREFHTTPGAYRKRFATS